MANTPKKITDPTEAALSAIQEALTARDTPVEPETGNPPPHPPKKRRPRRSRGAP